MKNIIKEFFSIFFALTLTSPVEASVYPIIEVNDGIEDEGKSSYDIGAADYTIMFLRSDFGLTPDRREVSEQAGVGLPYQRKLPRQGSPQDAEEVRLQENKDRRRVGKRRNIEEDQKGNHHRTSPQGQGPYTPIRFLAARLFHGGYTL